MSLPTLAERLIEWLKWQGTGGHPDHGTPDSRYWQSAMELRRLTDAVIAQTALREDMHKLMLDVAAKGDAEIKRLTAALAAAETELEFQRSNHLKAQERLLEQGAELDAATERDTLREQLAQADAAVYELVRSQSCNAIHRAESVKRHKERHAARCTTAALSESRYHPR